MVSSLYAVLQHGDLQDEIKRLERIYGNALGDAAGTGNPARQTAAQAIADAAEAELEAARAVLASRTGR